MRKLTFTVVSFGEGLKPVALWIFKLGSEPCVPNFENDPLVRPGAVSGKEPSNSPEPLEVTLLMLCGDGKMFTVIFYIVVNFRCNNIMVDI